MRGAGDKKLLLLFSAGDDMYACDAEPIIEVVPQVKLKHIHHSPDYIAGLINFGGKPIIVVDFCQMLLRRSANNSFHSRIILFANPKPGDGLATLGLIAERVTQTTVLPLSDFIESGVQVKSLPYLGGVLSSHEETVQLIKIKELFSYIQEVPIVLETGDFHEEFNDKRS